MHALFHVGTSCSAQCFCLFWLTGFFNSVNTVTLGSYDFFFFATVIAGVVVETFPFV